MQRRNAEGRARQILPFVAFYPALLEVEAKQNHINVRVFSEHSQPHWAWSVEVPRQGGVFLFTAPHMAYPHAFVSGPSFWVAAATGTSWNTPNVLNLTTGGFIFPPLLTSRLGDLFIPSMGGQVPARHNDGLCSRNDTPHRLFSKWVNPSEG